MAVGSIIPATNPSVTATINSATSGSSASSSTGVDQKTLAANFTSFLQLLTTQLKNQNPLDPLDTNQFTQQLVQFAQVEQQLKSNDQLATLVSLQKTAQATAALDFVGATVGVDGSTAKLANGEATWTLQVPKPSIATVNITNKSGQTVYSSNFSMNAGQQDFVWDGKGTNGVQWPDGEYTISITAKDAAGQAVAIPTEVEAQVESADLTKNPPTLEIAGREYTVDKIKRVVRRAS
jgi:flagellar basal-body rod modification protein FlgD